MDPIHICYAPEVLSQILVYGSLCFAHDTSIDYQKYSTDIECKLYIIGLIFRFQLIPNK